MTTVNGEIYECVRNLPCRAANEVFGAVWFRTRESRSCRAAFTECMLEATTGFEPVMGVLQTPALPLGYVAGMARPRTASIRRRARRTLFVLMLVPRRRFELLRLAARPPQDRVSAYSTTSAQPALASGIIIGHRFSDGPTCVRAIQLPASSPQLRSARRGTHRRACRPASRLPRPFDALLAFSAL